MGANIGWFVNIYCVPMKIGSLISVPVQWREPYVINDGSWGLNFSKKNDKILLLKLSRQLFLTWGG